MSNNEGYGIDGIQVAVARWITGVFIPVCTPLVVAAVVIAAAVGCLFF